MVQQVATEKMHGAHVPLSSSTVYEVSDAPFARLVNLHAGLERLLTSCGWTEGPAYFAAGRYLVLSDIPNDRMLRYDETDGSVSVFRSPSGKANGNTVDRLGRLVTCEHSGRRVSRTEHDGAVTTIAERWQGKRLNSPNDVVVKSDGSVWFTDPMYGIENDHDGRRADSEIGACNVYRVDPLTGRVDAVVTDMVRPNGLAFSPDERILYVVDSGRTEGLEYPAHIRAFQVRDNGSVHGDNIFAECKQGIFDGLRPDREGNVWTSAGDGVHCLNREGSLIGKIKVPEVVANLCFGGPQLTRLYICANTSLYAVPLRVNGVTAV
jgi:gluconolactonase